MKSDKMFKSVLIALGIAAFAPMAQAGEVITQPWLQNVYTNRFTVMCETAGQLEGLALQYGEDFAFVAAMTCTNGLKEGTWVYRAAVDGLPAQGATVPYRLVTNGVAIAECEGAVTLWKDEDKPFTCAIWGDNQEGVQEFDWGDDDTDERYRCIHRMFRHMVGAKPDFGFTTGDLSSHALYDEEVEPGELRGANDLFGRTIPFHLVWGNHDCIGSFFGDNFTNAIQRYFSPAASEQDGWFHLYRNDVLFIGIHWTWGSEDAEARYGQIAKDVEALLATDRAKAAKFRVLFQHAPMYLECWNVLPKIEWFSDTRLLDVAKAGGVDVVFSGHTHAYERIERDGLVQIVNGGMGYLDHGERWYNNYGSDTKVGGHRNTPLLWARQNEAGDALDAARPVRMGCFQGYGMLSVDGNTLTYRAHAFDANGDYIGVADAFTLKSKTASVDAMVPIASEKGSSLSPDAVETIASALTSPVNNATWKAYKTAQGEAWEIPSGQAGTDPVVNVSRTEIERFCAALNEGGETNYRLPTVAELTAAFGGNLERDVSEWTSDDDPSTGWCRILGGNAKAVDYTWCREADRPGMASPDCHADYLGFRVVDDAPPLHAETAMDKALAALALITEPAEIYQWSPAKNTLKDITADWTNATLTAKYAYSTPVIFTGKGDLKYRVRREVEFNGGLAAPNATSLDLSHVLDLGAVSKPVTVKGEFRGGLAPDEWRFYLKCDELTLDSVTYRGQVFNAVTDSRAVNLVGANDFSGAVMSLCVDKLLADPRVDFATNLVAAADASLALRRLDFSTRGVVEEVLGSLTCTAGFAVGENVTLTTAEDVVFGIKGATLTVDGTLEAAGIDIAGHLMGLLPQEATVNGSGAVRTTHFGMCDISTQYVGVANLTLQSAAPYRAYTDGTCNVLPLAGATVQVDRVRDDSVATNGVVEVADATWRIEADGRALMPDPLTGGLYAPKASAELELVYTLDAAKAAEGYRFANGETTVAFPMEKDGGVWVVTATEDEIRDKLVVEVWETADGVVCFARTRYETDSETTLDVLVHGGSTNRSTAVTLDYLKGTWAAKPKATVDGVSARFPIVLDWAKGDREPKRVTLQIGRGRRNRPDQFFTLQLKREIASELKGSGVATVTVRGEKGEDEAPYVRALAWPANGGTVSGSRRLSGNGARATLRARAESWAEFDGWYRAKPDDPEQIDLDSGFVTSERSFKVTALDAGTYYAHFVDAPPIIAVDDPDLEAATGIATNEDGVATCMVGLGVELPLGFTTAPGDTSGKLTVSRLPSGLKYSSGAMKVTGVPTRAGTYEVQLKGVNRSGRHTLVYTIVVLPMPEALKGTFEGELLDGDGLVVGTVTMKVSSSAKIAVRVSYLGRRYNFAERGFVLGEDCNLYIEKSRTGILTALIGTDAAGNPDGTFTGTVKGEKFGDTTLTFALNRE